MNNHGPLFEAQLNAVCNNNVQMYGGQIKSLRVGKFDTQIGPTCGLISIQVAAIALECDNIPKIESLIEFCQKNQYTKNGECFSIEWMKDIVLNFLPTFDAYPCNFPSIEEVIEAITNKAVYLVHDSGERQRAGITDEMGGF